MRDIDSFSTLVQSVEDEDARRTRLQASAKLFPVSRADEVKPRSPDWLIRGVFEVGQTVVLYSAPNVGKTLAALDWSARIACGIDWLNLPVRQGPVLYLPAEGRQGLSRRWRRT